MKKTILLLLLIPLVAYLAGSFSKVSKTPTIKIGILQTAPHPALDLVCQHFKEALDPWDNTQPIEWVYQNGMGQMSALQSMAQSLHRQKEMKLILAIATGATQALTQIEKEIPIIYTAVTDPLILKLPSSQSNVCGLSDSASYEQQVQILKNLWPKSQKVALIYNPSESNSIVAVENLKKTFSKQSLEVISCAAFTPAEIPVAASKAVRSADVVFVPADNLVAMTLELIARICHEAHVPLIAGYSGAVDQGADASYGVDYALLGRFAGEQAKEILKGQKNISEIGHQQMPASLKTRSNLELSPEEPHARSI
jgi:putative ABC transport system substrate-binding protein